MKHETAIGAQLAAKGFVPALVEYQIAVSKCQNHGVDYDALRLVLDTAYGKGSEGQKHGVGNGQSSIADASRQNDGEKGRQDIVGRASTSMPFSPSPQRSAGHLKGSFPDRTHLPAAAPSRDRAGQLGSAERANFPTPRPVSPAYISAAKHGAQRMALTVLDSFKVRDGRAIGDVPWSSIDRLISEGGREVAVLKMIRNRGRPTDLNSPLRLIIGVQEMERIIQKAAEMSDAA